MQQQSNDAWLCRALQHKPKCCHSDIQRRSNCRLLCTTHRKIRTDPHKLISMGQRASGRMCASPLAMAAYCRALPSPSGVSEMLSAGSIPSIRPSEISSTGYPSCSSIAILSRKASTAAPSLCKSHKGSSYWAGLSVGLGWPGHSQNQPSHKPQSSTPLFDPVIPSMPGGHKSRASTSLR
jgi:hypothetical protein